MAKQVLITDTYYETNGHGVAEARFEGGKQYPITPESQWQVARGNGVVVEVPDERQPQRKG